MEPEFLRYLKEHSPDLYDAAIAEIQWAATWRDNIIKGLETAITKTLTDNAHLVDGEDCTLIELKKVMEIE